MNTVKENLWMLYYYHIMVENVEANKRGGETRAAVVGLAPSEASAFVDEGGAVSIKRRSSLQESSGGESSVVGFTFGKHIHHLRTH